MMNQAVASLLAASVAISGCAGQQGQTVGEGAVLGAAAGGVLGGLAGGNWKSALIGAAVGGAVGTAAGLYVSQQKQKYATIEQRIDGERALAAQATQTAEEETAASQANLQVVEGQMAELQALHADRQAAQDKAHTMLARLEQQRTNLLANRKALQSRLAGQQAFIQETQTEVASNDPQKTAELEAWKEDLPKMQAAVDNMTSQVTAISNLEARVRDTASVS